jgi:hypothetical protein
VAYDLYFWKSASGEASEVCDRLADEDVQGVDASPDVLLFRAEVLRRWPDLADSISPWAPDLGWRLPWGREDLGAYFVSLTFLYGSDPQRLINVVALAHEYSLVVYDPQNV